MKRLSTINRKARRAARFSVLQDNMKKAEEKANDAHLNVLNFGSWSDHDPNATSIEAAFDKLVAIRLASDKRLARAYEKWVNVVYNTSVTATNSHRWTTNNSSCVGCHYLIDEGDAACYGCML